MSKHHHDEVFVKIHDHGWAVSKPNAERAIEIEFLKGRDMSNRTRGSADLGFLLILGGLILASNPSAIVVAGHLRSICSKQASTCLADVLAESTSMPTE